MLTTFDATFDSTFARSMGSGTTSQSVGGDGLSGVPGSVLPFSPDLANLGGCRSTGQGWERWSGVPISKPDYIMPFILAVPKPANVYTSPYCSDEVQILDADTGSVVLTINLTQVNRLTDSSTLYVLHSGTQLMTPLAEGAYRLKLGPAYSAVFAVRCSCLLRVRLASDKRIGNLLYDQYGWQQTFWVQGELTGPTFEESEEKDGDTVTSASVKTTWTLSLTDAGEMVAKALSNAKLHRIVAVGIFKSDGSYQREIVAMERKASAAISYNDNGLYDIQLSLPVIEQSFSSSATAAGCSVISGYGSEQLVALDCG